MRIGLFGGTFDPPHVGHLLAATDALETLELDRLIFVPAAAQPLKGGAGATARHRLAMVRLMAGADPRFAVDPLEVEREGLSYTVETLEALAAHSPGDSRYLLVGADVLSSFARWRGPARIRELAELVVLQRGEGGVTLVPDAAAAERLLRSGAGDRTGELAGALGAPRLLSTRRIDVSSTEIRARLGAGRSIHGFVPESVAAYIAAHGLYR